MKLFAGKEDCVGIDGYNTIDIQQRGDRLILITDSENFKLYREDVQHKWIISTYAIFSLVFLQLVVHGYLSYFNLVDCESKINSFNESHTRSDRTSKEITYICASYLMHIFLLVGYFFLAFLTIIKQNAVSFQVLEIYLVIMFVSDLFFSFINP